jgi:hypothetical protein
MKQFNHQLPKQARACAIAPVFAAMSWAFEGYNTPSITRGNDDQGLARGFIEGEKIPRI